MRLTRFAPFIVVLFLASCEKKKVQLPQFDIGGTVTLDSKPLEGATVKFVPFGTTGGSGAEGITNASGEYKLTGHRAGESMIDGDYKVVISRWLMPDGNLVPKGQMPANVGALESLPASSSSLGSTVHRAKVSASAKKFDFEVGGGR